MIELINNYWAVEVPDKYAQITIDPAGSVLMWWSYEGTETGINLPPGTWEIVCTSKATEEQATGIVQLISNGKLSGRPQYRRYDRDPVKDTPARSWTRDSRHALETLLTSKGCDLNKTYLILKKA